MSTESHNGFKAALEQPSPRVTTDQLVPTDSEYLRLLGETLRAARARRGMTRKMLASHSGVSERFLAQLESGTGNASVLILRQVARALDVPLEAMLPRNQAQSKELAHTIELLRQLDPSRLAQACEILTQQFGADSHIDDRCQHIALIGLRGAGKSTVGELVGRKLDLPFFELDRLIEEASGVSLNMIFDLYGQNGFRRFERRCLDELLSEKKGFVVATGGSLVSEPSTYERLLTSCYTVWLRATPQEHMKRVIAQGDMRPMAQNPEAMSDLERILKEREELYERADACINTSGKSVEEVAGECVRTLEAVVGMARD